MRDLFCLCCVLCIWVVEEKVASLKVGCKIPIDRSTKMRMSPWKSVSPACSIMLVIPEGPGDLSGCNFLISCLSSSGVNGVINKGCVVVVAVEACIFRLGRSLATSCALFSS